MATKENVRTCKNNLRSSGMGKMFKKSIEKSFPTVNIKNSTGNQQHAHVFMNSREENNYKLCNPIVDEPDEADQEEVVVMVDGSKTPALGGTMNRPDIMMGGASTVTSQSQRGPSNRTKEKSYRCDSINGSKKVLLVLFLLALAVILGVLAYIIVSRVRHKTDTSLVIVGLNSGLNNGVTRDVYKISLQQRDSISAMKDVPYEMMPELQAVAYGQNVYVIGAGSLFQNSEMWRLDLPTTDWSRRSDMITGRRRHCAVIVDSQLYVLGGWVDANRTAIRSVESYSIATNTWTSSGDLIHAVQAAACVVYNNIIYVFGGSDSNNTAIVHVQLYSPATQQCTLLSTVMPFGSNLWMAVLWETSVILLHRYTCLLYNFEAKTWLWRNQFKTDVNHFGVALYNQTIYIAGGAGKETQDKNNATISIPTDEIKSVSVLDIIGNKIVIWKHHANLPQPSMIHAYFIST